MKTLLIALFASLSFSLQAQSIDSTPYMKAIDKAVTNLEILENTADLRRCKETFVRMTQLYKKQWLPAYYSAYCSIELVYWERDPDSSHIRLREAADLLKKLETMEGVDQSELETLWGYYYMCFISTDPVVLGFRFFDTTVAKFKRALELNPENPRPVVLLALFEQRFPNYVEGEVDYDEQKEIAEALFKAERKSLEKPYWGREFLEGIQVKSAKEKKKKN